MSNTRENAARAVDLFLKTFEAKYPKATLGLQKDRDELLAFYDFFVQSETDKNFFLCSPNKFGRIVKSSDFSLTDNF